MKFIRSLNPTHIITIMTYSFKKLEVGIKRKMRLELKRRRGHDTAGGEAVDDISPAPLRQRHRRQTGLFVLDSGRGISAAADNRLKKVKMPLHVFVQMSLDIRRKRTALGIRKHLCNGREGRISRAVSVRFG